MGSGPVSFYPEEIFRKLHQIGIDNQLSYKPTLIMKIFTTNNIYFK